MKRINGLKQYNQQVLLDKLNDIQIVANLANVRVSDVLMLMMVEKLEATTNALDAICNTVDEFYENY